MADNVYDIIFLGGGPAGYQGAIRAAQLGQRAAVIEELDLGGICLNRGCIPTKAIKASVDVLRQARQAKSYGLRVEGISPDLAAIIARKDRVVKLVRGGVDQLLRANRISIYTGRGEFIAPGRIAVLTKCSRIELEARETVICTGTRPRVPAIFAGQAGVLGTDDMLRLERLPASLIIVGAGAIGVEMAAIMAALGSQVTLVEARERILPGEDAEMSTYLGRMLKRQKVKLLTGVSIMDYECNGQANLQLADGTVLQAEALLVAAGRIPNIEGIGLEKVGLDDQAGAIEVNECMQTRVPGIYAAGDVSGGWLLAHVAFAEGITAAENAAGLKKKMDYRVVPRCVFSVPEFAAVGLSEKEAQKDGPIESFSFPLRSLGMAQALGEWEGLVKLIVKKDSGEIQGGHIIGPHASDLIGEIALAMKNHIPAQGIMDTIHTHPSLSEAILEAASAACGQAIHILPPK